MRVNCVTAESSSGHYYAGLGKYDRKSSIVINVSYSAGRLRSILKEGPPAPMSTTLERT
jgi:hypothetical protein